METILAQNAPCPAVVLRSPRARANWAAAGNSICSRTVNRREVACSHPIADADDPLKEAFADAQAEAES